MPQGQDRLHAKSAALVNRAPIAYRRALARVSRAGPDQREWRVDVEGVSGPPFATRHSPLTYAKWGIFGRSPRAFPLIGARGSFDSPVSMMKLCASEYHGAVTSGAGALPFWCNT